MLNISTVHASSARAMGRYFYHGATGELTMLDAVLAMANGYPDEGHELLDWTQMERSLAAVRDPAFVEAFPVRWRPDMSQRLEDLLRVDRDLAPDIETVTRMLANRTSNGDLIPGKHYLKGTRRDGAEPQAFLSMTFSAPKSVSVAWAFAEPDVKHEIRRAHQAAVETALRGIEERIGWTRKGSGGSGREAGDMTWITFFHTTSRFGDPQLHSHVAVLNVVASRESDRVGGFDDRSLRGTFTHFREVYQQELAANLTKVGLSITYDREKLEAKVNNIPENVITAFSTRQNVGKEAAKHRIEATGQNFDDLPAEEQRIRINKAVLDTRPPVEVGIGDWTERIDALGWNPAHLYENHRIQKALEAPERRAFGLRLPDGGYHVGGEREMDWGITR